MALLSSEPIRFDARHYDALRPVILALPGMPLPVSPRPLGIAFLQGTVDESLLPTDRVLRIVPLPLPDARNYAVCPSLVRLLNTILASGADGIVVCTPLTVVGLRTILAPPGTIQVSHCLHCLNRRCYESQAVIKLKPPVTNRVDTRIIGQASG